MTEAIRRADSSGRRRPWLTLARHEAILGYAYISPWIIGYLVFTLGPVLASFYLSLTTYAIIQTPRFTGVANYARITTDPTFWKSLENTYYYACISVPVGIVGSLLCALLLNRQIRGRALFRTIFFLPSVTPVVASMMLWIWLLNPQVGLINYLLGLIGIDGPGWLSSATWSKPALIIINLWGGIGGGTMLIFLAGLQGIPIELHEAAEIDGAGPWSRFWRVTLPLLTPTIFFSLVMSIIAALQVFATAYVASSGAHSVGGPSQSTLFYVLNLYKYSFMFWEMGYGSALAWVFFFMVLILTYLQLRMARSWVYYETQAGGI
jgi:multiple sugar transport system permease protein